MPKDGSPPVPIKPTRKQIRAAIKEVELKGEPVTLWRVCRELRMAPRTVNRALDALRIPRFPPGRPAGTATEASWLPSRSASNG